MVTLAWWQNPDDAPSASDLGHEDFLDEQDRVIRESPEAEGMMTPVACDECGTIYDEARGDGYCGLCPSCADKAYEAELDEPDLDAFHDKVGI